MKLFCYLGFQNLKTLLITGTTLVFIFCLDSQGKPIRPSNKINQTNLTNQAPRSEQTPQNEEKVSTGEEKSSTSEDKAKLMILKSESHTRGDSLEAEMSMTVISASSQRKIEFKTWLSGQNKTVIKIVSPIKDKDIGNLRLDYSLWQYLPNIDRVVKIPPSMMLQSWMGSDFTNDDLVKSSSLSRDYTHQIEKVESIDGVKVVMIVCTPKPEAPVTWGKVIVWLREQDSVPIKQEFYSENNELLKKLEGSEIKTFGKHTIPTLLTMTTVKKKDSKTILQYKTADFDQKIDDKFFTQEFIRKIGKY